MKAELFGGYASRLHIAEREEISGGFSGATKYRVRIIIVHNHGGQSERTGFLKQTSAAEVSGLHAATKVSSATAIPTIIAASNTSDNWVLMPFYVGHHPESETALPANVVESLARMHIYYLNRPIPSNMPVADPSWWQAKCLESIERLTASAKSAMPEALDKISAWANSPLITDALNHSPRTLLHGDVHRNNIIIDKYGTGHLIDWGDSLIGMPAFDIVNFCSPRTRVYDSYMETWRTNARNGLSDHEWWRSYLVATVCMSVRYLPFAARHFGLPDAQSMLRKAAEAYRQLNAGHI
jgi:aminoglycoside phosphotransferase (APT) family kinase protein